MRTTMVAADPISGKVWWRSLVAGLLVMALLIAGCSAPATKVSLPVALAVGQITATFTTRGSYGDIIVATITSTTNLPIEVTIVLGMLLKNASRNGESLAVVKYKGKLTTLSSTSYQENAQLVLRNKNDQQISLLEAYSVNALADPAQAEDTFVISGTASTAVLKCMAAFGAFDTIQARQIALWVVTDNVAASDLGRIQFAYKPADVDSAKAILQRVTPSMDVTKFKLFAGN